MHTILFLVISEASLARILHKDSRESISKSEIFQRQRHATQLGVHPEVSGTKFHTFECHPSDLP